MSIFAEDPNVNKQTAATHMEQEKKHKEAVYENDPICGFCRQPKSKHGNTAFSASLGYQEHSKKPAPKIYARYDALVKQLDPSVVARWVSYAKTKFPNDEQGVIQFMITSNPEWNNMTIFDILGRIQKAQVNHTREVAFIMGQTNGATVCDKCVTTEYIHYGNEKERKLCGMVYLPLFWNKEKWGCPAHEHRTNFNPNDLTTLPSTLESPEDVYIAEQNELAKQPDPKYDINFNPEHNLAGQELDEKGGFSDL